MPRLVIVGFGSSWHLIDAQGTIRDAVPSPITGERARLGIKRAATAR